MLLAGKPFILAAAGGTGKGFFELQLAVCMTLGLTAFDILRPASPGHVALIVGEDDIDECRHRLWRVLNALELSDKDRGIVGDHVLFVPFVGHDASLLTLDRGGAPVRTDVFKWMVDNLNEQATKGGFDWRLVCLDPLARFANAPVESDNGLATHFIRTAESLSLALPGQPAVGIAHHSSKTAKRTGTVDARGVTGLHDGVRAVLTMRSVRTDDGTNGVLVEHAKSNCARAADPIWLVRRENEPLPSGGYVETAGALRLATSVEQAALERAARVERGDPGARRQERQEETAAAKAEKLTAVEGAILEILSADRPIDGTTLFAEIRRRKVLCRDQDVRVALAGLARNGSVRDLSGGSRSNARQWVRS